MPDSRPATQVWNIRSVGNPGSDGSRISEDKTGSIRLRCDVKKMIMMITAVTKVTNFWHWCGVNSLLITYDQVIMAGDDHDIR